MGGMEWGVTGGGLRSAAASRETGHRVARAHGQFRETSSMGAMKMGRNGRQRTFCESEDEASLARHAVSSGTVLPLGPWNGEGPRRTEPEAVLLKMLQSTKVAVPE